MKQIRVATRVRRLLLIIGGLLLATVPLQADPPGQERMDAVFSEFDRTSGPGCAVGVGSRGDLLFSSGYGMADLDYGIPISSQSRFFIASVSKQFAAASLWMLEQEALLDLDQDLREVLPELEHQPAPLTARQILHHTSGIRDLFDLLALADVGLDPHYSVRQTLELIARQKELNFEPGSAYSYSNSAYFLVSILVERLTGRSLDEYAREHFFLPSGMASTHFHDDTGRIVPDRVSSYRPFRDGYGRFIRDNLDRTGARGLVTTVEDLIRWEGNFYENRTSLDRFTEKMTTPGVLNDGEVLDYASGLRLGSYNGLETVSHGGNYMGFKTHFLRFPGEELAIAVLCNGSSISPSGYAYDVAELWLEEQMNTHTESMIGTYCNVELQSCLTIRREGADLFMERRMGDPVELSYIDEHRYSGGGWSLLWGPDRTRINIETNRTAPMTFERRE
ncbi:MAG: serine hydrolase domain-containing protein [Balneolaceae bacterium]